MTKNKFCVINCENSKAWNPISFADMFRSGLERPGDIWTICNLASDEPLPEDIESYQGLVITGSRFNCRDRDTLPWFNDLCELIRESAIRGSPQIYGGCFGCQIIAHALGGEVDYNPTKRFVFKAEEVKWAACNCSCNSCHVANKETTGDRDASSCNENCCCSCCPVSTVPSALVERLKTSGLRLLESHGDCVCRLPEEHNATLLAASATCGVEMFVAGSRHNLWASQSHPEFDLQYAIRDRIWVAVVDTNKRLNEEEITTARDTFATYESQNDASLVMQSISDFLHRQGPDTSDDKLTETIATVTLQESS